ncbi:MAG: hypothetical protein AAB871_01630 [Patescibacteria group bacterium]
MSETNNLESFKRYLEEQKGKPVDPRAVSAAQREMELGKKGDYPVYRDEPGKEVRMKGHPEGKLFETDMTEEELGQAISKLEEARKALIDFLEKPNLPGFDNPKTVTLFYLEDQGVKLPKDISAATSTLAKYDFSGDLALFEVPEEINQVLERYTATLEHLKRKSPK